MEKRNRLWRKRHQWRLFKAKMVLFANYPYPHFIDDEGTASSIRIGSIWPSSVGTTIMSRCAFRVAAGFAVGEI